MANFIFNSELKLNKRTVVEGADPQKLREFRKTALTTEKWMDVVNGCLGTTGNVVVKAGRWEDETPEAGLANTLRGWSFQVKLVKRFSIGEQQYLLYQLKGGRRPTIQSAF